MPEATVLPDSSGAVPIDSRVAKRRLSTRRLHKRLNPKLIDKLACGRHADGDGLILQVAPSGSRSWILRTVVQAKRRDIGLGGYPLVSLKDARDQAEAARRVARAGGDPIAE